MVDRGAEGLSGDPNEGHTCLTWAGRLARTRSVNYTPPGGGVKALTATAPDNGPAAETGGRPAPRTEGGYSGSAPRSWPAR